MKRTSAIFQVILFRFRKDLLSLRTAALTFTTALSVVPLLAVMFGVAKGFGLERILEDTIRKEFADQQDILQYLIHFSYSLLEQAKGGLIAGIGVISLFYTVLKLLSTIEGALNSMWGIARGRTIGRKIVDFSALVLIYPIIFVVSSSLTVYVTAYVKTLPGDGALVQIKPMMLLLLSIAPYVMSIGLFTFLYIYMPNIKVKFSAALIAGLAAGIASQLVQAWYIYIQILVNKTGAIYGSFAAIPLFFVWLYISWMIFLLGAEIVVICQERLWDPEVITPHRLLNRFERQLIYLAICRACLEEYRKGITMTSDKVARSLRLPVRLATEIIDELVNAGIFLKADGGVIPAKAIENISIGDLLAAIDGENRMLTSENIKPFEKILSHFRHGDFNERTRLLNEI